jgi:hypothetical protein
LKIILRDHYAVSEQNNLKLSLVNVIIRLLSSNKAWLTVITFSGTCIKIKSPDIFFD